MKNIYKILISVIILFSSMSAMAQNRVVTGIVKDAENVIPGASVFEKGNAANGVITNVDGKFSITLRGTSNILIVRSLSYITQEVNVAGQNSVTVTLNSDVKGLEEVVVVGYATQKKINVTSSISSVNREEIQQTPSASLQNALVGKLPGFFSQQRSGRPGADAADFFIRGVSTPSGNQSPLILVDDIVFTYADFANIDPNEVQSLSILKDAAATAPYGIQGANGVILVTTRRGTLGVPSINIRAETGFQAPTQTPKFLDSYEVARAWNEASRNDAIIAGTLPTFVPLYSDDDLQKYKDGSDPYGHPNVDWYNTLFRKFSPNSNVNMDISGGTNTVQYFVSLGYEDQGGMLRDFKASDIDNNYSFNRFNFRSNLDIKATNSLSIKVNFSGNNTVTNSPKFAGSSGSAQTAAFYEVYNFESLNPLIYNIYNPDGSYGYTNPNHTQPSGLQNNIVGRISYGGYDRARQNLLNVNVSAVQELAFITKGLQAKITLSTSNSETATKTLTRTNFPSFYYDSGLNTYTPRDASIFRVDPFSLSYAAGTPRRQSSIQANLNYQRTFGKHNVSALLLYSQSTTLNNSGDAIAKYIPTNLNGVTSRVTYSLNNKYLMEFDGSYNGTDKFAAGRRYGFFPAGSIGYVVSEEKFIKNNLSFINLLKFRGSYGIVGSDNLQGFKNSYEENYIRGVAYSLGESPTTYTSIVPSTLSNLSVTWEKQKTINLGMDFSIFNGKLSGSAEIFSIRRYDILSTLNTVPHYFGVPGTGLPPENLGIVENKGYEMDLTYSGKIGKDFSFRLKGNISFAKNKIIEIDEVTPLYPWQRQTGHSIGATSEWIWDGFYSVAEAADPTVPKYIGSTVAGVANTCLPGFLKYRDLNGDGVVSSLDQGYFGNPNLPPTVMGFNVGLNYKRISFNVLMQAATGNDLQINYNFAVPFKGNLQAIVLDRWNAENPDAAKFPTLVTNFHGTYQTSGSYSTYWSIPGDYLRIKSVELGYQLPERWATGIGFKGVRIYANAYNLYTWSASIKKYGLDPETVRSAGSSGVDGIYPQCAIVNIGVNVTLK